MARTVGAKNKTSPATIKNNGGDNEDIFLDELLKGYTRWKAQDEEEYAEAYRVLLNRFTTIDEQAHE